MVVKSSTSIATQAATKRLEKVIESHRSYFSEWRSEKFSRADDKLVKDDKREGAQLDASLKR